MVVAALVVGSWWQESLRRGCEPFPWLGAVLLGLAGAALVAEIVTGAGGMLDVFTHLLIFLLLVKLYTLRTLRDARDVAFLSFFTLVAASPVTTSLVFLGLFVTFLVVGTWLLMLRHLMNEADIVAGPTDAGSGVTWSTWRWPPRRPRSSSPRCSSSSSRASDWPRCRCGRGASRMVTGFTERVQLGAFGEIEADATVVMRVHLTSLQRRRGAGDACRPCGGAALAFDHFDGRTWTVSRSTLKLTLRRELPVPFPVHQFYGGPVLTQEIRLEPMESQMIFGAPRRAAATDSLRLRHDRRPRQRRGAAGDGPAAVHGGVGAGDRRSAPGGRRRRPAAARPALAGALHAAADGVAADRTRWPAR